MVKWDNPKRKRNPPSGIDEKGKCNPLFGTEEVVEKSTQQKPSLSKMGIGEG